MANASAIGKGFAGIWGLLRPLLITMAALAIASLVVVLAMRGLREGAATTKKGGSARTVRTLSQPFQKRFKLSSWNVPSWTELLHRSAATDAKTIAVQ